MSQKTVAELQLEMHNGLVRQILDLNYRLGVEQTLTGLIFAAIGSQSSVGPQILATLRSVVPAGIEGADADRFAQLVNERADSLHSMVEKLKAGRKSAGTLGGD